MTTMTWATTKPKRKPVITLAYLAHLQRVKPTEIDKAVFKQAKAACRGERPTNNDYWNAMAHANQMHGNISKSLAVSFVYSYLMGYYS
jgi:hypothetical protein